MCAANYIETRAASSAVVLNDSVQLSSKKNFTKLREKECLTVLIQFSLYMVEAEASSLTHESHC